MTAGDYREHAPSSAFRPFVSCFWTRTAPAQSETRVLPDGAVDILFELESSSAEVIGTMTRPLVVSAATESTFVAARFRPGAAQRLFGISMKELTDGKCELASLWRGTSSWVDLLLEAATPEARVQALERLLGERLDRADDPEPRVAEAVRRIEACRGSIAVSDLSRELGVSRQHLKRLFEKHVGVGVKFFSRVARLKKLLLFVGPSVRFADLALEFDFYDQAHFGSDFKALTGLTPGGYLASRAESGD